MLTLTLYDGNEAEMLPLIVGFWLAHNGEHQTAEESRADLQAWTGPGHRLYAIRQDGAPVGLVHLGSRGPLHQNSLVAFQAQGRLWQPRF